MVSGIFQQTEYAGYILAVCLSAIILLLATTVGLSFLLYRTGAVISLE